MPSWWRDEITRIRPGVKEIRGQEIPDWDNADTLVIKNCSVQPAGTSLSEDGRILGISDGMTAYIPRNADVKAGDRIAYDGQMYTINGEPRRWNSVSGRQDHIRLDLMRWSG